MTLIESAESSCSVKLLTDDGCSLERLLAMGAEAVGNETDLVDEQADPVPAVVEGRWMVASGAI